MRVVMWVLPVFYFDLFGTLPLEIAKQWLWN
nr:MAG TPA: hypothetical protein [Caudoviricetes sp.]